MKQKKNKIGFTRKDGKLDMRGKNQKGENNPNWKGDNIKYYAVHRWIETIKGKPKFCENCKEVNKKVYDWANVSGSYKRVVSDWERLCRSCHMKLDGRINKLVKISIGRTPWNKGIKK